MSQSVSLAKNQKISLTKENGRPITNLYVGLGWDPARGGLLGRVMPIDLDASVIMFDSNGNQCDAAWYGQLRSRDGSTQHCGDNLTGHGKGDDEKILIDLSRVAETVQTMIVVVNSFRGQSFKKVANASCHLIDQSGGDTVDLGTFNLSAQGDHTAIIMASIKRAGTNWEVTMIGEPCNGRTFHDLMPFIAARGFAV